MTCGTLITYHKGAVGDNQGECTYPLLPTTPNPKLLYSYFIVLEVAETGSSLTLMWLQNGINGVVASLTSASK